MAELVEVYADVPLGTTNAAVVVVAERLGITEIATPAIVTSTRFGPGTLQFLEHVVADGYVRRDVLNQRQHRW